MRQIIQQLRPDSKGRITLGKLAEGVSSFHARLMDDGTIVLEPFAEIPAREKWLFGNPAALGAVRAGLEQAAAGKTHSRGSFAKYADEKTAD
jgi:hypothetical protein